MKKTHRFLQLAIIAMLALSALTLTGCKPVRYVEIGPDETAFAIPLQGDRGAQQQLLTEEYLNENKISAKRYQIPYVRLKRAAGLPGYWAEGVKVIKVDLKPVTRAWTGSVDTGTSAKNQALVAETRDSIGFSSEMNASAAVNEGSAAKFVHFYYGKSLDDVMDLYIRPYAQQLFTEKCALYTLDDQKDKKGNITTPGLLTHKAEIMEYVRKGTREFFASRGIDILSLGMQGEVTYLNKDIQASIDKRIQSKNDYEATKFQNQKRIETAQAAQREAQLLSGPTAIRLRQLEIQRIQAEAQKTAAERWNGTLPTTMLPGSGVPLVNVK